MGSFADISIAPLRPLGEGETPEDYVRSLASDRKSGYEAILALSKQGVSDRELEPAKKVWLFVCSVEECAKRHKLGNSKEWTGRHLVRKNANLTGEEVNEILANHDWSDQSWSARP